jgi:hypothetical protein
MSRIMYCDFCDRQITESFPAPERPEQDFCSEACYLSWEKREAEKEVR